MELAFIIFPVFIFALLKVIIDHRATARSERVRLLEEALKNPSVDRPTLESLAFQLTGARPPRVTGPSKLSAIILAIGWIALFTGIGLWVMGVMVSHPEVGAAGMITAIVGFGFVTYPFALRELEARRAPQ